MVLIARTKTGRKLHLGGLAGQDQGMTSACGVDLVGQLEDEDGQAELDNQWSSNPDDQCLRCEIAYRNILAEGEDY